MWFLGCGTFVLGIEPGLHTCEARAWYWPNPRPHPVTLKVQSLSVKESPGPHLSHHSLWLLAEIGLAILHIGNFYFVHKWYDTIFIEYVSMNYLITIGLIEIQAFSNLEI